MESGKERDGKKDRPGTEDREGEVVERYTVESEVVGPGEMIYWIEDSEGILVSEKDCAAALNAVERVKAVLDKTEARYKEAGSALLLADLIHITTVRQALEG